MHWIVAKNRFSPRNGRYARALRRWALTTLVTCLAFAMLPASAPGARAQDAGVDTAARGMLPAAAQRSGVLHVGLEINYAPWMYQVGQGAVGIDPDLIRAISAKLGLKPEFAFVTFDAILPGVQSGRFDVGANFANTAARRNVVSFVNYLKFVDGLLVTKGNPDKVNVKDLCGMRISAGVGSFQHANMEALSEQCVKNGKPPITLITLDVTNGIAALRAGRVNAEDTGMVANVYAASQPSGQDLEALPNAPPIAVSASTLGYITSKDPDGVALAHAMAAALNAMVKSGEYATILRHWKVPDEAELKEAFAN